MQDIVLDKHCSDAIMDAMVYQITSLTLFRRRSKKISKLRVTGLCAVTGEIPAQMASNTENVSIWWRHHVKQVNYFCHLSVAKW